MSDTAELLAGVPMLAGLDRKHLEQLARDFTPRTFPAGSVVVREGDKQGIGFFVIEAGEGVVTIAGKQVAVVKRGDSFGEVALVSDRVRTATVTATTDLTCQVMTMWDFRAFVRGDAEVAWRVIERLGAMLHSKG
jgi:CRP-like cAMP-binding protein